MKQTFLSALIWIYWFFCFTFFLVVITILFLITYPFDTYRKIPNKALKGLGWFALKPVPTWSVEIKGADKSKVSQPTLIVSNHQSFLDLPLLYLLPWQMKWVAKKSMLKIPILGWMIAMTGHLMIDRKSLRSYKKLDALVRPVRRGIPALVFPEGTRTRDGSVQPFKKGAFTLAQKYNFQVLAIVHYGGHEAMPRGSWKFHFNKHFVISVLEPVDASHFETAEKLKDEIHQQISSELHAIQS